MKKKLAIIGGGRMAGIIAINARQMNIESHCFSPKEGIIEPDLFDVIHDVDVLDKNNLLKECKKTKIDGVLSTTELTIAPAAYISSKLNLIGIDYTDSVEITDKYKNREKTKDVENLKHPKYTEIYSIEDILKFDADYPVILKPRSRGGKRGITVIYDKEQAKEAFEYAVSESDNELPFILEEYIDAPIECSIETLTKDGITFVIQITRKKTSGAPHCVELAHFQPAELGIDLENRIAKIMQDSLQKIGLKNGACHTEIKIKGNDIFLIEFNARPGGDHIAYPLTQLSTGYEYIKGAISIALGDFYAPDVRKFKHNYSGVIFITQQTMNYKKIFDTCEKYDWCYLKHDMGTSFTNITHNDGFNKNYFIYSSKEKPIFIKEMEGEIWEK